MKWAILILAILASSCWADGAYCAVRGEKKLCDFESKWDCEEAHIGACVFNTETYDPTKGRMRSAQSKINNAGAFFLAQVVIGIGTVVLASQIEDPHSSLTVLTVGGLASVGCGAAAGWILYTLEF